jgi:acetyl-CoA synthetase
MARLTEFTRYADAQAHASSQALWELFDGDREHLNIAHECIGRHADGSGRAAVRIAHADGADEFLSFDDIAAGSARFAHWLDANGIQPGDRIAFMLEPSLPFYVCLFGAMQTGAISVPLFTLFGLDGLRLRVDDCKPKLLITNAEKAEVAGKIAGVRVIVADAGLLEEIARFPGSYETKTRADDLAVFQYTSGTTRELPEAVKHTHRALVTLMFAALYGTGVRPGDEFFCPSSPAWGHGLWHGTLAPLALGVTTGTFAGRFDATRLMKALQDYRITNMSAAATHYRMMNNSGRAGDFTFSIRKLSYTGEPIDPVTLEFIDRTFGRRAACTAPPRSAWCWSTIPARATSPVKPGSLGKPVPGSAKSRCRRPTEPPTAAPGVDRRAHAAAARRLVSTKDLGEDRRGRLFLSCGRADDVIISAGWTMSAVEIENTLLKHPDVGRRRHRRARRHARPGRQGLHRHATARQRRVSSRIQNFTRERSASTNIPRQVEFVTSCPRRRPARSTARCCAIAKPPRRPRAPTETPGDRRMSTSAKEVSQDHRQGLDDLRKRIGVKITEHARAVVLRGDARQHPPLRARHRRRQPAVVRPGVRREDAGTAASSPCRASCFRPAASSRAMCGGLPGVHAMWAGADWTWHKPVLRNDAISTEAWLKDLIEHETRSPAAPSSRSTTSTSSTSTATGRRGDSWCFRTERDPRASGHQVHRSQGAPSATPRRSSRGLRASTRRGNPRRDPALLGRREGRRALPRMMPRAR